MVMLCHVALPYEWVECFNGDACRSLIHFEGSAVELNATPREWMKEMLGFSWKQWPQREAVFFCDSNGKPSREDGAMVESSDGVVYWYKNNKIAVIEADGVVHHGEHTRFLMFNRKLWALGEATMDYVLMHPEFHLKLRLNGTIPDVSNTGFYTWRHDSYTCRLLSVTECSGCDNPCCGV